MISPSQTINSKPIWLISLDYGFIFCGLSFIRLRRWFFSLVVLFRLIVRLVLLLVAIFIYLTIRDWIWFGIFIVLARWFAASKIGFVIFFILVIIISMKFWYFSSSLIFLGFLFSNLIYILSIINLIWIVLNWWIIF
jgi:hypothetical protein